MKKYNATFKIFVPRSLSEPTNGTQRTWQVVSQKGKVKALCLSEKSARQIAKALNK